jgi:hypothetical protein
MSPLVPVVASNAHAPDTRRLVLGLNARREYVDRGAHSDSRWETPGASRLHDKVEDVDKRLQEISSQNAGKCWRRDTAFRTDESSQVRNTGCIPLS